jgi:hypothetical protein
MVVEPLWLRKLAPALSSPQHLTHVVFVYDANDEA